MWNTGLKFNLKNPPTTLLHKKSFPEKNNFPGEGYNIKPEQKVPGPIYSFSPPLKQVLVHPDLQCCDWHLREISYWV